nr:integrase, catalytic region, zinc finger, CCHC-type, peptidase aspartic, catalytic [Tanacetum cinerariifolium]
MSRDVITVGLTMRILLLYRGEYLQWRERFMNYLEEQTDGEAMINSIQNGDQPLPVIAQVSLAGTAQNKNQGDVNDALRYKKKAIVLNSDPLALVAKKTNSANKKQEFVKSDDKKEDTKADDKKRDMNKVKCYNCKKEGHFAKDCKKAKVKDYNYYKTKTLLAKKDSDEQVFLAEDQAWMESNESSSSAEETIAEVSYYTSESVSKSEYETLEYYDNSINYGLFVNNDDQEIFHDAIESAGFENLSYFRKAKDLRPTLYDEKVIGLGYTPMFLTHSNEALEIEKFKRSGENIIKFAYDYGILNASYVNEKINFKDDYFQEILNLDFEKIDSSFPQTSSLKPYVPNVILEKIIIDLKDEDVNLLEKEKVNLETIESLKSKGFESSETAISELENQSENDCLVVENKCDKEEHSKVITLGMYKLSVSQSVSQILMLKTSCDSKNVDNLDTFSSVRRPKHSSVIWNKKGSSNTSNVDLSAISHSNLNKNVKRYSRKDLLACNNSHLGETCSAYVCNDTMNVSCNHRMCDLLDDNNFFIFDDESVRISPVRKMAFRKKPHDSMNVCSKSNMIKSLPRTVHKLIPKLQPLAEPVAKWFPRIVHICLWIIDSEYSKHMTGNRAMLTNFVEKFLRTVRFGNNDFAVIAGCEDVVIGSMTIKKVYYVEGLG